MASLVYIRELRADTFLHFSYKQYNHKAEESWKLRDYANDSAAILSQETSTYSANDIRAMAKKPGNHYLVNVPYHSINDVEFWQKEIEAQNNTYHIGEINNNPIREETMPTRNGLHGQDGRKFEELDFAGQARSINGQILSVERAIIAHKRRASEEAERDETETLTKCIEQVSAMLQRLRDQLPH